MSFRRRYVWVVRSPKGVLKVFAKEDSARSSVPNRLAPRALDSAGNKWVFGKKEGHQFFAQKLPIEDSDNLPT